LFSAKAIRGRSIERIRRRGCDQGALYYHFEDKEALAVRRPRRSHRRLRACGRRAGHAVRRTRRALHAVADICVEQATRSNHRRFMLTLIVEALDTHPALSERFDDG